jgi:hypothetical protein
MTVEGGSRKDSDDLRTRMHWSITIAADLVFVSFWIFVIWLVNENVIRALELSGIDRWQLRFFQSLFAISTFLPPLCYIMKDASIIIMRAWRRTLNEYHGNLSYMVRIYAWRIFVFALFVIPQLLVIIGLGRLPIYILFPLLFLVVLFPPILLIFSINKRFREDTDRVMGNIIDRIHKRRFHIVRRGRKSKAPKRTKNLRFGSRIFDLIVTSVGVLIFGLMVAIIWYMSPPRSFMTVTATESRIMPLANNDSSNEDTEINQVLLSPDNRSIIVDSSYGTYQYDASSSNIISTFPVTQASAIAFSANGRIFSAADADDIQIISVPDYQILRVIKSEAFLSHIALSPDGSILASSYMTENSAKLWRVADGSLIRTLLWHIDPINSLAFSPDGSVLATGSEDQTVRLWRVEDGTPIGTLGIQADNYDYSTSQGTIEVSQRIAADAIRSVIFSPDGTTLAAGLFFGNIKLWKVPEGLLLKEFAYIPAFNGGRGADLSNVVFSPDGRLLAAGVDEHVVLWTVHDGKQYKILEGHSDLVSAIAFAPDGNSIVSGSWDNTLRVWPVEFEHQ